MKYAVDGMCHFEKSTIFWKKFKLLKKKEFLKFLELLEKDWVLEKKIFFLFNFDIYNTYCVLLRYHIRTPT